MNGNRGASTSAGDNLLQESGLPLFFEVADSSSLRAAQPENRHGQSVRIWARSLTVMQKEAVVLSVRSGRAWRLASDEGSYLDGHDFGPCPLSFMTTGMVSAYMHEILAAARQRHVELRHIELVQENHYAMEGSALRGTMTGSAMPVDLEVRVDCDLEYDALSDLVKTAVLASPLHGLLSEALPSLFTLSRNGEQIQTGKAKAVDGPALPPPRPRFDALRPARVENPGWIRKVLDIRENPHRQATPGSSLMAEQKRTLLLRGTCRLREDGVKEIRQEMFNPAGSDFVFLCDETEEFGGRSRAPDAVSYVSAGIAFCFMTQLGRYAKILKKNLDAYDVIQDTHFPSFGAQDDDCTVDPVETHVYLQTDEDDAFARQALDLGEQTCYLHALCRTPLETKVKIVAG